MQEIPRINAPRYLSKSCSRTDARTDGLSKIARTHRGKTVTKPLPLSRLGLPLSEKQIPQVIEKLESGGEPKEALDPTPCAHDGVRSGIEVSRQLATMLSGEMVANELIEKMRRDWDRRAVENHRYYIVNSRTDWSDEEFWKSGETSVSQYVLTDMGNVCQGRRPADMRVLDFGCGAGRVMATAYCLSKSTTRYCSPAAPKPLRRSEVDCRQDFVGACPVTTDRRAAS